MRKVLIFSGLLILIWYIGHESGSQSVQLRNPFTTSDDTVAEKVDQKVHVLTEESSTIKAIEKALPSVVTIKITRTTQSPDRIQIDPFNFGSPFRQIPGRQETLERNIGSGFAVGKDVVVTNKHVVSDPDASYSIILSDKEYKVVDVSRDPLNDLALLKIDKQALNPITLSDSNNLKLGQHVIAIGTPLGEFTNTVTTGIVSGLGRGITAGSPFEGFVERLDNVIQTDAAINPGNSGGPLLNSKGDVIGINTAVSQDSQNIGFAIPVNVLKDLLSHYNEQGGFIQRPFLGVRYQMLKKDTALLNDVPEGAYVVEVVKDSPADKAGIQIGDIITYFNGRRLQGTDEHLLQKTIASLKADSVISLTYWRDNKSVKTSVKLSPIE